MTIRVERPGPRHLADVSGQPTTVEVEVIFSLVLDVAGDRAGDSDDVDAIIARRAVEIVRGLHVPDVTHPQTGAPVDPEIWYYGECRHGCPKVGYGSVAGEMSAGKRITRSVRP
jgi:hypothetical protein